MPAFPPGAVGYWKLDENTGTAVADATGRGHGGTLTGSPLPTWGAAKLGASALSWGGTGTGIVDIPHHAELNGGSAFTFSAWVYPTNAAQDQVIASKWDYSTQGGWSLQTGSAGFGDANDLLLFVAPTQTANGVDKVWTANNCLASGGWHHVAFVFDGSLTGGTNRAKLYVDGVLQPTTEGGTVPTALYASTATMKIGRFGGSLTRPWNGRIDEVGCWGRALTAGEIADLYNGGAGLAYGAASIPNVFFDIAVGMPLAGERLAGTFLCGVQPNAAVATDIGKLVVKTSDAAVAGQAAVGASLGKTVSFSCAVGAAPGADERMLAAAAATTNGNGSYNAGTQFNVTADGQITHVRYWASVAGTYLLNVWDTNTQTKLITDISDVVSAGAVGWREIPLLTPLNVVAGKNYTVSRYFNGALPYQTFYPTSIAPHLTGLTGTYVTGTGYPVTAGGSHYYVDVVYHALAGGSNAAVGAGITVFKLVALTASFSGQASAVTTTLGKSIALEINIGNPAICGEHLCGTFVCNSGPHSDVTINRLSVNRALGAQIQGQANVTGLTVFTRYFTIQIGGKAEVSAKLSLIWLFPTPPVDWILIPTEDDRDVVLDPTEETYWVLVPTGERG